jgi:hypothetical protein
MCSSELFDQGLQTRREVLGAEGALASPEAGG